jgi:hypothetical protein
MPWVKALARAFRWRRMSDEDMHATLEDLGAEHRSALRRPSHAQRLQDRLASGGQGLPLTSRTKILSR